MIPKFHYLFNLSLLLFSTVGFLVLGYSLNFSYAQAQSLTVTGKVLYNPEMNDCFKEVPCTEAIELTREEDWIPPKAAVNILVKGNGKVTRTDREGNYEIEVPSPDDTLMFLYIGHNRVEIPVRGRQEIDLKLTPTPIPVIERLLGLIMPKIDAGTYPGIDALAEEGEVNRATARDILWLVLGNRVMANHYPEEFIPDYRFEE